MNENNRVIVKDNAHDPGSLVCQSTFLHNTKIANSVMNEKEAFKRTEKSICYKDKQLV